MDDTQRAARLETEALIIGYVEAVRVRAELLLVAQMPFTVERRGVAPIVQ